MILMISDIGLSQIAKRDWISLCKKAKGEQKHTCKMLRKSLGIKPTFFHSNWGKVYDELSNRRELSFIGNFFYHIVDLSPLAGYTNLAELYLDGNRISDLSPLEGLSNLKNISLRGNRISDLAPLAGLNLDTLDLGDNWISNISPLSDLTNLTDLALDENRISEISPLSELTNLRYLWLEFNQISDISPLSGLRRLLSVELHDNMISDLTPLAGLTNLILLRLWNNQITDLTPLFELPSLRTLFLQSNLITEIPPLENFSNLERISIIGNPIQDFSQFDHIISDLGTIRKPPREFNLIKKLPIDAEINNAEIVCPICLNEYKEGAELSETPACHHLFHKECLDAWLKKHANCPFCRTELN